jgi:hypothetical protein
MAKGLCRGLAFLPVVLVQTGWLEKGRLESWLPTQQLPVTERLP